MSNKLYLMDFSLALVNRTGAYHICRDLLAELPEHFSDVRYWRLILDKTPHGLARRLAGRAMMLELRLVRDSRWVRWPDGRNVPGRKRLILDPLYVLRSRLDPEDIVQCHDIGPVTHPELFPADVAKLYDKAYDRIRDVGPGMVFVSDATQRAFRDGYGDRFRFMQTVAQYVRPGVLSGAVEACPGVKTPFLLTVGALERRKNHLRIIEAYRQSGLHERGVSYVFCGARGLGYDEIFKAAARTPGVVALNYVSEPQLRWLYTNGSGFVLPSLLEGFGLPAIEAAHRGLVPLVTKGSAQEEAVGGAGILVDPQSTKSLVDGLLRLVDMGGEEKAKHIAKARQRGEVLNYARYISGWRRILANNSAFPNTDGWAASDPEEHLPATVEEVLAAPDSARDESATCASSGTSALSMPD